MPVLRLGVKDWIKSETERGNKKIERIETEKERSKYIIMLDRTIFT